MFVLNKSIKNMQIIDVFINTCVGFLIVFLCRFFGRIYNQIWRYGGIQCYIRLLCTDMLGMVLYLGFECGLCNLLGFQRFTISKIIAMMSFNTLLALGMRMCYRYCFKYGNELSAKGKLMRLLLRIFAFGMSIRKDGEAHKIYVAIVGAGAEGIEWARIFKYMDAEVTLIEKSPRLLPPADTEVSKRLERIFKQQGIKFYTSTTVEEIKDKQLKLSNGEIINPDYVLVAVGRNVTRFNTDAKVTYLGDAYGSVMLATFAMYQVRALLSDIVFDNVFIPSVVFGTPEIAWIGANEQDLPNGSYEKVVYPLTALGKAYCDNATDGFIKILTYQDYIIGAHIIGKEASALIHEFAIAMQNNIKVSDMKKVCFAHLTYSEAVYESILRL